MKISNKAKDYIKIIVMLMVVAWLLSGAIYYVTTLFAEEMTINEINKSYAEQTIQMEMRYLAMWEYTESMTDEEYNKTFMEE